MKELTIEELNDYSQETIQLVDIRDEGSVIYGMMPGAINITYSEFVSDNKNWITKLNKDQKIVLYCQRGEKSKDIAEQLESMGYDSYSLTGGFGAYLINSIEDDDLEGSKKRSEESIRKKFHKQIFSPFAKACKTYELIKEGDHIAVCISGGKDSMLMAKLFQEIKRHRKVNFELTFLVMDPGYNAENRKLIESNAKRLGIPITIFESTIFDAVDTIDKNPCYLCARMRRGYLYSKARELGCNKIALGHHYDDVIETILMGMLHGGQIQTMMPKRKIIWREWCLMKQKRLLSESDKALVNHFVSESDKVLVKQARP